MKFPTTKKLRDAMAKDAIAHMEKKLGPEWKNMVLKHRIQHDRMAAKTGVPGDVLTTNELRKACDFDNIDQAYLSLMLLRDYLGE